MSVEDYFMGVVSSYELDFWGRLRSEREAALLEDMTASREDLNTAATTLAAEVTQRWINIIAQRMQKSCCNGSLKPTSRIWNSSN